MLKLKKSVLKLFNLILYWRLKRISNRNFLIIASIIVGVVSALAAVALKLFVNWLHGVPEYFAKMSPYHLWYIFLPLSGVLLTVVITQIFFKGYLDKGLGSIIYSISRKSARVEKEKMYSHLITSAITVGLGGSAGLEAPIVITGSAIGSNIAKFLNFGYKERALFLACGAASGIAAVFNSPVAGVIFALEVLLTEISIPVFIPLLISTATSIIVSKALYKGQLFFLTANDWHYNALPYYILLGILCGLISVYMIRTTLAVENFFNSRTKIYPKALWGGLFLGMMVFIFPPLFGEGYITINSLLHGSYNDILAYSFFEPFKNNPWTILIVTTAIILMKVVASAFTVGAGGNGGIFAPSLFTGALVGFGFSFMINTTGINTLQIGNFIVVGMAGVLSGVVHAPLTAIFLIAEMTGGYVLFVPLMIVSALSYFIGKHFEPYSVYTKKLAQQGHLHEKGNENTFLHYLTIDDLIERDFIPLKESGTLKSLVDAFNVSNRNVYPVVDNDNKLLGIIHLEDIKKFLFQKSLYNKMKIIELTDKSITPISKHGDMQTAISIFEKSNLWIVPVTDGGKYVGFISRSNILSHYRKALKQSAPLF